MPELDPVRTRERVVRPDDARLRRWRPLAVDERLEVGVRRGPPRQPLVGLRQGRLPLAGLDDLRPAEPELVAEVEQEQRARPDRDVVAVGVLRVPDPVRPAVVEPRRGGGVTVERGRIHDLCHHARERLAVTLPAAPAGVRGLEALLFLCDDEHPDRARVRRRAGAAVKLGRGAVGVVRATDVGDDVDVERKRRRRDLAEVALETEVLRLAGGENEVGELRALRAERVLEVDVEVRLRAALRVRTAVGLDRQRVRCDVLPFLHEHVKRGELRSWHGSPPGVAEARSGVVPHRPVLRA